MDRSQFIESCRACLKRHPSTPLYIHCVLPIGLVAPRVRAFIGMCTNKSESLVVMKPNTGIKDAWISDRYEYALDGNMTIATPFDCSVAPFDAHLQRDFYRDQMLASWLVPFEKKYGLKLSDPKTRPPVSDIVAKANEFYKEKHSPPIIATGNTGTEIRRSLHAFDWRFNLLVIQPGHGDSTLARLEQLYDVFHPKYSAQGIAYFALVGVIVDK
jgi:hypothetical protein